MIDRDDDARLEPYRHVGDPRWLAARGLFVAEGRLVVERLLGLDGYVVESVLVTPAGHAAVAGFLKPGVDVFVASQAVVNGVTGFNFHRGCLALARRPVETEPLNRFADARRLVVLEGVGNPDNLGGIFRSAAALGADGIVLDPSSGDPWYRKAVRTSMGAVLRLPFTRAAEWPEALEALGGMGFEVAALTPTGELTLDELRLHANSRIALLAGAEGPGVTPAALAKVRTTVRIPVDPRSDSLNVAVAVSIALAAIHTIGRR